MTRLLSILICASVLLGACNQKKEQDGQTLLDASKQELATALSERDELISLMTEIASATDQIKHMENILSVMNEQPEKNPTQKTRILSDIELIKQTLQQRREQLEILEAKLKQSNLYTTQLQGSIDALRQQLDSQTQEIDSLKARLDIANRQIGTLTNQVDSLSTTVQNVNLELTETQDAATRLENELNTCYYVIATKSVLKEHKILETGFLRKSKLLKGDFDKGFFVIGDKRTLTGIDLNTTKAKVLSTHPRESYEIIDRYGKKVLEIKSPDKFWDQSNYLVVQID